MSRRPDRHKQTSTGPRPWWQAVACGVAGILYFITAPSLEAPSHLKSGSSSREKKYAASQKVSVDTLPPTQVHQLGRGFTCFDNLYGYNGHLWAHVDPSENDGSTSTYGSQWTRIPAAQYMRSDGVLSSIEAMSPSTAQYLWADKGSRIESVGPVVVMNEWKPPDKVEPTYFSAHYGHFIEQVMSALTLQANAASPVRAGLSGGSSGNTPLGPKSGYKLAVCCRCHTEKYAGEGQPLNRWVTENLWGAPLKHCNDLPSVSTWGEGELTDRMQAGKKVWHFPQACMVDRYVAHRDWHTDAVNNCNALLMRTGSPQVQMAIEAQIQQFRNSAFIQEAKVVNGEGAALKDELGQDIGTVMKMKSAEHGPLVVIVKRMGVRNFEGSSFDRMVAFIKEQHSPKRTLVVRWELLPGPVQLALASYTDVMVGMQGNGLSHLFWMPMGAAVLEFYPHYRGYHGGEKVASDGTVWTNDWPYMTRLKGLIYRAIDCSEGEQSPVGHPIADMWGVMSIRDSVINIEQVKPVVNDIFAKWKQVQEQVRSKGWDDIDMRRVWNPRWTPEDGEEPFYRPQAWHYNHNHTAHVPGWTQA